MTRIYTVDNFLTLPFAPCRAIYYICNLLDGSLATGKSFSKQTKQLNIMKKILLFCIFLSVAFGTLGAQDVIVFRNGDELQAKVTKLNSKEVYYHRFDNLEGPEYVTEKSKVFFIKFQNGTKEVFQETEIQKEVEAPRKPVKKEAPKQIGNENGSATISSFKKPKFQTNLNVGMLVGGYVGGMLDVALGARINPYFFIGFEDGFGVYPVDEYVYGGFYGNSYWTNYLEMFIPLAVNAKIYAPFPKERYFYGNFSLGMNCLLVSTNIDFYARVGVGFDIKWFSMGLDYQYGPAHAISLKVGVHSLGRK